MQDEATLTTAEPNAEQNPKNTVQADNPDADEIRTLAYEHWIRRSRPYGSPQEDSFWAERELGAIRGQ